MTGVSLALAVFVPALFFASLSASHAAAPAPSPTTPALVAAATKEGSVTFYTSIDLQMAGRSLNVAQPEITLPASRGMRDPLTGETLHVMVPATRAQTP